IFDTWAFGEVRDRTLAIAQAPTCPLVVHLCGEHMLETLVPVPAGEEPLTLRVPVTASRSVRVELVDEGGTRVPGYVSWKDLDGALSGERRHFEQDGSTILVPCGRVSVEGTAGGVDRDEARVELPAGT